MDGEDPKQNIDNPAPNQGAQGAFHGPVTIINPGNQPIPPHERPMTAISPKVVLIAGVAAAFINTIIIAALVVYGWPVQGSISVEIGVTGQGIELIKIPAGSFLMGSTDDDPQADEDEKPLHVLDLPIYWIDKTEVTNAQFRPFVDGDGYTNSEYWTAAGWHWRVTEDITQPLFGDNSDWNDDQQPVGGISWYEAVAYAHWLSKYTSQDFRLPTEVEWKKVARGIDGRIYP